MFSRILANEKKEKGRCGKGSPLGMFLFKRIEILRSFLLHMERITCVKFKLMEEI